MGGANTTARFLFGYFPALAQLVLVPIAPLYRLYTSVPFISTIAFFGAIPFLPHHLPLSPRRGVRQRVYAREVLGDGLHLGRYSCGLG